MLSEAAAEAAAMHLGSWGFAYFDVVPKLLSLVDCLCKSSTVGNVSNRARLLVRRGRGRSGHRSKPVCRPLRKAANDEGADRSKPADRADESRKQPTTSTAYGGEAKRSRKQNG